MPTTFKDLKKMIDHSLLHPTLTDIDIVAGCRLAMEYDVKSVCVKPYFVERAASLLKDSNVKVGCVIGFPHGNSKTSIKVLETREAINDGAAEIDMVINIGKAIGKDFQYIKNEIEEINTVVKRGNALLKVIFENDYLSEDIIIELCRICNDLDVAFVKTSSGYGFVKQPNGFYSYKGATTKDLKTMRMFTKSSIQVKAAGGIRTLEDLLYVRSIGVTRIGATATAKILDDAKIQLKKGIPFEYITPHCLTGKSGY